jgi:lysophospholipase L1-like esterase
LNASTTDVSGAAVAFAAPTTTGGVAPVQVSCTRQSGSMFTQGTTPVQCTAIDSTNQSVSCQFNVTVVFTIAPRITRTKFLAFGDSLTAGEVAEVTSGLTREGFPNVKLAVVPAAAYPMQLQNRLRERYTAQASSIEVVNAGLPGEWAQDGRLRFPNVIANARPEVVIIAEGYNDAGSQVDAEVRNAAIAINAMAQEARTRGARVILTTLPPPRPSGSKAVPLRYVTDFNARVRTIATAEGALLVDFYEGMVGDISRYMGIDGLHPSEAGYARMAELLFNAIRSDLEQR